MQRVRMRFRVHGALSGLAIFLTIAIFALMVFALTILGARGYRSVVDGGALNARDRILRLYVVNKLRAAQSADAVSIETDLGMKILRIADKPDETDGSLYATRIYCHEGNLMESYDSADAPFDPESGEALCAAREMDVRIEGGLCEISITAEDGSVHDSCVYLAPGRSE